jgi:hypothetical protein
LLDLILAYLVEVDALYLVITRVVNFVSMHAVRVSLGVLNGIFEGSAQGGTAVLHLLVAILVHSEKLLLVRVALTDELIDNEVGAVTGPRLFAVSLGWLGCG